MTKTRNIGKFCTFSKIDPISKEIKEKIKHYILVSGGFYSNKKKSYVMKLYKEHLNLIIN